MNTTSHLAGIGLSPEAEARLDRAHMLRERTRRIVDRALPRRPEANGFYEPVDFIAGARRNGERERLFWRTFARLRAKMEGGKPCLKLPADCPAVADGAMGEVARELAAEAG